MKKIGIPPAVEKMAAQAVDAAFAAHQELGPGLLESAYAACMARELDLRGIQCQRQLPVPWRYKGKLIDAGFRVDALIEQERLIELKAVEDLVPVHHSNHHLSQDSSPPIGFVNQFQHRLDKERHLSSP